MQQDKFKQKLLTKGCIQKGDDIPWWRLGLCPACGKRLHCHKLDGKYYIICVDSSISFNLDCDFYEFSDVSFEKALELLDMRRGL